MKTKNNVQKTNFKTIVVLSSLVLSGLSLSAQNSDQKLLAFKDGKNPKEKTEVVTATPVSYPILVKKVVDPELQIENWMVNGSFFRVGKTNSIVNNPDGLQDAKSLDENPLQVEDWMIESNFWNK